MIGKKKNSTKFLKRVREEGEGTGIKVNPDTVAKTMRRARNKNNERVSQQVASYFSRKKISQTQKVATFLRRLFVAHVSNTS